MRQPETSVIAPCRNCDERRRDGREPHALLHIDHLDAKVLRDLLDWLSLGAELGKPGELVGRVHGTSGLNSEGQMRYDWQHCIGDFADTCAGAA